MYHGHIQAKWNKINMTQKEWNHGANNIFSSCHMWMHVANMVYISCFDCLNGQHTPTVYSHTIWINFPFFKAEIESFVIVRSSSFHVLRLVLLLPLPFAEFKCAPFRQWFELIDVIYYDYLNAWSISIPFVATACRAHTHELIFITIHLKMLCKSLPVCVCVYVWKCDTDVENSFLMCTTSLYISYMDEKKQTTLNHIFLLNVCVCCVYMCCGCFVCIIVHVFHMMCIPFFMWPQIFIYMYLYIYHQFFLIFCCWFLFPFGFITSFTSSIFSCYTRAIHHFVCILSYLWWTFSFSIPYDIMIRFFTFDSINWTNFHDWLICQMLQ